MFCTNRIWIQNWNTNIKLQLHLLWAQWLTWNRSRKKMNVICSDRAQRMPDRWKYHRSHDFSIISYLCWKCLCSFYSKSFICIWREVGWIFRELVGRMGDAHSFDRMPFQFFIWKPMSDSRDIFVCACMRACLKIAWCFQYLWNRGRTVCASRSEFQLKEFMLICFVYVIIVSPAVYVIHCVNLFSMVSPHNKVSAEQHI